jgi:hypothetical protein
MQKILFIETLSHKILFLLMKYAKYVTLDGHLIAIKEEKQLVEL